MDDNVGKENDGIGGDHHQRQWQQRLAKQPPVEGGQELAHFAIVDADDDEIEVFR